MNSSAKRLLLLVTAMLVAFLPTLAIDHPPPIAKLLTQLNDPSDVTEVERIAAEVETMALSPGDESAAALLDALSVAWYRKGRYDEALEIFERLVAGWPDTGSLTYLKIAQIRRDQGDEDREIDALKTSLTFARIDTHRSVMDADNTSNIAYRRLAEIYENREEWARSLAVWQRWEPQSWCGNEATAYQHEKQMGIARCNFHLKNAGEALASIWKLVAEVDCLNGRHPGAAFLYAELSAKAGRIGEARRNFRRLPRDRRARFMISIDIWQGYLDKAPQAILDALAYFDPESLRGLRRQAPIEFHGAARLLTEMGPEAAAAVEERILEGDLRAVAVAAVSGNPAFIPTLQSLRQDGNMSDELERFVNAALERLGDSAGND